MKCSAKGRSAIGLQDLATGRLGGLRQRSCADRTRKFPMSDHLREAFAGTVTGEFDQTRGCEKTHHRNAGRDIVAAGNLQPDTASVVGEVIAVAEFYENADGHAAGLAAARLQSWAIVSLITSTMLAIRCT